LPQTINHVTQTEVHTPYRSYDVAMTERNVVTAEYKGSQVDVYSLDLDHLYNVPVPGALYLRGVATQGDVLLLPDRDVKAIHVLKDVGKVYSHKINLSWSPRYAKIIGKDLFIPDYSDNKLYKLTLDKNFTSVRSEPIIKSYLSGPFDLHVDYEKIAVGNTNNKKLIVFHNDGRYNWHFSVNVRGIERDVNGQYLVVDFDMKCILLFSADGHFIKNIVEGINRNPLGLTGRGNTLYLTAMSPNKLYKFVLT
jgi:hypothetical protein